MVIEFILGLATIIGGASAVWYFYEKFQGSGTSQNTSETTDEINIKQTNTLSVASFSFTLTFKNDDDLKELGRQIFQAIAYSMICAGKHCSLRKFNFLMSYVMSEKEVLEGWEESVIIRLTCHVSPFVSYFNKFMSLQINEPKVYLKESEKFDPNIKIKMAYKFGKFMPYEISMIDTNVINIRFLGDDNILFSDQMLTSDLFIYIYRELNNLPIIFEGKQYPDESSEISKLVRISAQSKSKLGGIPFDFVSLNQDNPEEWHVTKNHQMLL